MPIPKTKARMIIMAILNSLYVSAMDWLCIKLATINTIKTITVAIKNHSNIHNILWTILMYFVFILFFIKKSNKYTNTTAAGIMKKTELNDSR